MKTLIFNGSPRLQGDTAWAIEKLQDALPGDVMIVNAYRCQISPCVDCRYCKSHSGCAIQDEMQMVYHYIQSCDNIIIASPVYFSELTGKMLDVASRLQTYFCARCFRKETPIEKPKKGGVILVGGGKGDMGKACSTAEMLLKLMNCQEIHPLVSTGDTDHVPACEDPDLPKALSSLAAFLRKGN